MTTVFVSRAIWPQLTKAVRGSRQQCAVAVAYFGAGASRLLPLVKGSRLVVDASERAVMCGQTCPADLLTLVKRGVVVFSVPNLHAKVFVLGRAAYIGSTNVSNRSAGHLLEAAIRTTEPGAVSAARQFVHKNCLHELSPKMLKQLAALYRPPRLPGGNKNGRKRLKDTAGRATLPRLLLAQLELADWSEREENLYESGLAEARKRRLHPRRFVLNDFCWPGKCAYRRGDVVVQVTDQPNGSVVVSPPGNVLHVRTRRDGTRRTSIVYLECPAYRRRHLRSVAQAMGITQKRLRRNGAIRASLTQALLKTWTAAS